MNVVNHDKYDNIESIHIYGAKQESNFRLSAFITKIFGNAYT